MPVVIPHFMGSTERHFRGGGSVSRKRAEANVTSSRVALRRMQGRVKGCVAGG